MSNLQLRDFFLRLRRIEDIHRRGGGFEAVGTLGQSYYTRLKLENKRRPLLRPTVTFVAVVEIFKGLMIAIHGQEQYAAKVAHLLQGGLVEQIGGYIMAIDPLALTIAQAAAVITG